MSASADRGDFGRGDRPVSLREEQVSMTRRRLVDAARQVFAAHGFGPVLIKDIAGAAGVNRATFYRHFDTKAAVMVAVAEEVSVSARTYWETLDHVLVGGSRASLRQWLDSAIDWWEDNAAILPALHEASATDRRITGIIQTGLDQLATRLCSYLGSFTGDEQEHARITIQMLILQLDTLCFQWLIQEATKIDRDLLLDLLSNIWSRTLQIES
jgi:AcrR family transcriptional regulator